MEIIDNKGAPPELVRIINKAAEDCKCVTRIVFDAFITNLEGAMGAFSPDDGTIYIDLGRCIVERVWMKKGFMFIPNAWLNMLMTAFHEIAHAAQLDVDPELAKFESLPQKYEDEATEVAGIMLINWAETHPIPKLNELGWVGNQLKMMLNQMYSTMPEVVNEELEFEGTEVAAYAAERAQTSREYNQADDTALLLKQIDEGMVGVRVGDRKYLTAYEAVGM